VVKVSFVWAALAAFVLCACENPTAANGKNFSAAVSHYLEKKGELCLPPMTWPVDVKLQQQPQGKYQRNEIFVQMKALEAVGLVQGENIGDDIRRYSLSAAAQVFVKENKQPVLCWGQMALDELVQWDIESLITDKEAQVKYTYKIDHLADWAHDIGMRLAFPVIKDSMLNRERPRTILLKRTANAWEVSV